ncbi:hypothetical protein BJV77DRAFT_964880 [Russula vinacea]|nr:hypothetical protein BJV77DRAFT_964880 [Russula vinacea]
MAHRTCQSQPRVVTNLSKEPTNEEDAMLQGSTNMNTTLQCSVGVQNQMIGHVQNNLRVSKKRTSSSCDTSSTASTNPGTKRARNIPPAKKARKTGPVSGSREVSGLTTEEREDGQGHLPSHNESISGITVHQPLQRSDVSDVETEANWLDELDLEEPGPRRASKFSEAVTIERPSWSVSAANPGLTSEAQHTSGRTQDDDVDMPQEGIRGSAIDGTLPLESPQYLWPADTNIVFSPGSNKIALTCQRPLIRVVIQDAMENVRADLLFKNAYPDPAVALVMIKESLLASASRHPGASSIRRRLVFDEQYMTGMIPLPRARIPLYRSEVKERCAVIVSAELSAITSEDQIRSNVMRQLSVYNYTFPTMQGMGIPMQSMAMLSGVASPTPRVNIMMSEYVTLVTLWGIVM